ncbi:MAG: protein kinase, partial [Pseudomonadota bacterium]
AHGRNIVHRDLSPDNIILRSGDPAQAVIIDFGIAKDTNPGAETIVGNEFAGKYAYAAPEQLHGRTDARTDLYALGAALLANFRGAAPDLGANPMEVIQSKSEPLDTSGVPEPLKTLIDRMTAPDPDARFPSARAVLDFLDAPQPGQIDPEAAQDDDAATVIPQMHPTWAAASEARAATQVSDKPAEPGRLPDPAVNNGASNELLGVPTGATAPAPAPAATGNRTGRLAAAAVVALSLAAGGAYVTGALDGVLGPRLPVADPYDLTVIYPQEGTPSVTGHVPDETLRDAVAARLDALGGTADLTLARGDLPADWGSDILTTLDLLAPLSTWQLSADGASVEISGTTTDPAVQTAVMAGFADGPPGALDGSVDIALIEIFLDPALPEAALESLADCGPLSLTGAGPGGFGPDTTLTVQGRVAATATRVQAFDDLRALAGDRQIVLDLEVLNPTLCMLDALLPAAPAGGVEIDYSLGDTAEANASGIFLVGENPVIDVVLPADMTDGYLSVSIIDVSGNVYHLLPNLMLEGNSVADLRAGRSGPLPVRVAFADDPARTEQRLVFRVDDSALGKSEILAIHSTEPLFDGLRPMTESAEGYAEALRRHADRNAALIDTIDRRRLVTQAP